MAGFFLERKMLHVLFTALFVGLFVAGCSGTDSVSDVVDDISEEGELFVKDVTVLDGDEDSLFNGEIIKDLNIGDVVRYSSAKSKAKSSSSAKRSSSSSLEECSSSKAPHSSSVKSAYSSSTKSESSSSAVSRSSSSKASQSSSSSDLQEEFSASSALEKLSGKCTVEKSTAYPGEFVRWTFNITSGSADKIDEYTWYDRYGYNSENMDYTLSTSNNSAEFAYTAKNTGMKMAPQVSVGIGDVFYIFVCEKVQIVAPPETEICGECVVNVDTAYTYQDVVWKFIPGEGCSTEGSVEWVNLDAATGGLAFDVDSAVMVFSRVPESGKTVPSLSVSGEEFSCPAVTIVEPPPSSSSAEPESSETKNPSIDDDEEIVFCEGLVYMTLSACERYMNQ